jgi:hypothetical protein
VHRVGGARGDPLDAKADEGAVVHPALLREGVEASGAVQVLLGRHKVDLQRGRRSAWKGLRPETLGWNGERVEHALNDLRIAGYHGNHSL